jgi:quercetin dioxygenase-like cupin family protein
MTPPGSDRVTHYSQHVGTREGKHYKTTLFEGVRMMVGLNCLEPGQTQPYHDHADADKVYVVMEGRGWFVVDDEPFEAGPGEVVWAPAGIGHGVENRGTERLVLLVGIAPPPGAHS